MTFILELSRRWCRGRARHISGSGPRRSAVRHPQLPGRVRVDKGGSDSEGLTPLRCPPSFSLPLHPFQQMLLILPLKYPESNSYLPLTPYSLNHTAFLIWMNVRAS